MSSPPSSPARADLSKGPLAAHLWSLGAPMVVGLSSVTLFNVADTYFVGQLGTTELAAMALTFPVMTTFGSFAMGLGVGTTSVLARTLGEGDEARVRARTRDALLLSATVAALVSAVGLLTMRPVFRALGADETTMPHVVEYMTVWYLGMSCLMIPMAGNACLRALGDARTPAAIMTVAGGLNVLLDPVFIFGWGPVPAMGIRGAAVASVLSRATTLVVAVGTLAFRERVLALHRPRLRELLGHWRDVLRIAAPATASQLMEPLCFAVLTGMLAAVSAEALGAFGAGAKLMRLAAIPMIAASVGVAPLVGQNLAAGHRDRVRETVALATRFSVAWGVGAWLLVAALAWPIARLFSPEPLVVVALVAFLRLGLFGLVGEGAFKVASSAVNAAGRPGPAMGMMLLRLCGLVLPLAWLGRAWAGAPGVFGGMGLGYALGGVAAWAWARAELGPEGDEAPGLAGAVELGDEGLGPDPGALAHVEDEALT